MSPGVHVLCGFDANYLLPAAVTIRSMVGALGDDERCDAHLVGLGVDADGRRRLEQATADPRLRLRWHQVDEALVGGVPRAEERAYLTESVYVRLFLDRFLPPEVERVLFLDVDTVVCRSVAELFAGDLGDAVLAAARDLGTPTLAARNGVGAWRELGLDGRAPYLNAGVLVIDRPRWRAADIEHRTLDYLRRHAGRLVFNDQEALNAVLAGAWREFPTPWNAQVRELQSAFEEPTAPILSFVPESDLLAARDHPAIVHFSGWRKPWTFDGMSLPMAGRWWDVAAGIPWAPAPPRAAPRRTASELAASVGRRLRQAGAILRHG